MTRAMFSVGVFFDLISIKRSKWELELRFIKGLENIGHVEVLLEYPYSNTKLKQKDVKWLKGALEGYNVIAHAPFSNTSICTPNEYIRNASIKEYRSSIDIAKSIGAKLITFHTGHASYFADRDGVDFNKILKKGINPLIEHARKRDVKLAIENLKSLLSDIKQTRAVLNMFPKLGLTLDVGHYYINKVNPEKAINTFLPRIWDVHLHDVVKEKGELEDHKELGSGFIDTKSIIRTLIKNKYKRYLTIESVGKGKVKNSYLLVKEIIKTL